MIFSIITLYHYVEWPYAEWRYAEWRYAEWHYADWRYAEWHYAEWRILNIAMRIVIILTVIVQNAIRLSIVAPFIGKVRMLQQHSGRTITSPSYGYGFESSYSHRWHQGPVL
jgi:hypothetical protein